MIYRRTPATPTKLLLRVMAGAGTGALVGMSACGFTRDTGVELHEDAAAVDAAEDDGGDDGAVLHGLVIHPHDAGEDARVDAEAANSGDSGSDAHEEAGGPCNGGVCGVVVHQEE